MRLRLCPKCLKEFKREHGKKARKENGGTWKSMEWPSHLYHESEGSRLCKRHKTADDCNLGKIYSQRASLLLSMGYTSYEDYLHSELWKSISNQVKANANHKCKFCKETVTQVHHSQYDLKTLQGEDLKHLHAICAKCHLHGEYFSSGDKSNPYVATQRMQQKQKAEPAKLVQRARRQWPRT